VVKLDRYIGIHVFLAILTVLGIIVGLALLFAFIESPTAHREAETAKAHRG